MNAYKVTSSILSEAGKTASFGRCAVACTFGDGVSAEQVKINTIRLLADPRNGYNHFDLDTHDANGMFVNDLGTRQFAGVTEPNSPSN